MGRTWGATTVTTGNDPDTGLYADLDFGFRIVVVAAEHAYPYPEDGDASGLNLIHPKTGETTVLVPTGTWIKVEGTTVGNFDDSGPKIAACDQKGHRVSIVDLGGAVVDLIDVDNANLYSWPHDAVALDIDGDGRDELLFSCEGGNSAARGGWFWADCTGDAMNPADWDLYTLAQHPGAWHICERTADFSGNDRGDLLVAARNNRNNATEPGVFWLEKPEDPTDEWTEHTIVSTAGGPSNATDWLHADFGEFCGDDTGLDVISFTSLHDPGPTVFRFSDDWADEALPDNWGATEWARNIRTYPNESGRDSWLYVQDHGVAVLGVWHVDQWRTYQAWSTRGVTHASDGRLQVTDGTVYVFDSGANKVRRYTPEAA